VLNFLNQEDISDEAFSSEKVVFDPNFLTLIFSSGDVSALMFFGNKFPGNHQNYLHWFLLYPASLATIRDARSEPISAQKQIQPDPIKPDSKPLRHQVSHKSH
jgi:hypothetical protein